MLPPSARTPNPPWSSSIGTVRGDSCLSQRTDRDYPKPLGMLLTTMHVVQTSAENIRVV